MRSERTLLPDLRAALLDALRALDAAEQAADAHPGDADLVLAVVAAEAALLAAAERVVAALPQEGAS